MVEHGKKTGSLDFPDWDIGIARGLGALWDDTEHQWYLPIDLRVQHDGQFEPITRVPVVVKRPEPTNLNFVLPQIVISMDNVVPAPSRRLSEGVEAFRVPAPGATRVSAGGQLGWSEYETKGNEKPYDLSYTIECWARYRSMALMLVQIAMAKFEDTGRVTVIDSLGVERIYAAYQQGVTDLTQLGSMVDRVPGYALSLKVEGELTLNKESFTLRAFTGSLSNIPPTGSGGGSGNGTVPDPGPGGLYGTGKPIIRTGIVEDV